MFKAEPALAEVKFDVESEQFKHSDGSVLTDEQLGALLGTEGKGIDEPSGVRGASIGEAIGVATAKRAIVAKTILEGMDSPTAGRILDGIDAKLGSKGLEQESSVGRVQ